MNLTLLESSIIWLWPVRLRYFSSRATHDFKQNISCCTLPDIPYVKHLCHRSAACRHCRRAALVPDVGRRAVSVCQNATSCTWSLSPHHQTTTTCSPTSLAAALPRYFRSSPLWLRLFYSICPEIYKIFGNRLCM